jgi:hypothetical protein
MLNGSTLMAFLLANTIMLDIIVMAQSPLFGVAPPRRMKHIGPPRRMKHIGIGIVSKVLVQSR